jgi:hypothetical protein
LLGLIKIQIKKNDKRGNSRKVTSNVQSVEYICKWETYSGGH